MIKAKNICLFLLPVSMSSWAGVDPYAMSLEELMNVPVTVSSRKALSQRETPGSVTVITGEEIRHSGARDLIDVLRQVPGFDFRVMVNNGLGLGMRGHIGSDGRVQMLVDGIEVNEHRYGSAIFGQGFPIEQISRIEIVRGSAMALYGGTAEMGVINITTRGADDLDGVHVGGGVGFATGSGARSRQHGSVMAGKRSEDGSVKWTAMLHASRALRSDRIYQGIDGATFDMAKANAVSLGTLNLGLQVDDFSARYLHDEPQFNDRDGSGFPTVRAADFKTTFNSDSLLLQYRHQGKESLTLSPSVLYQSQNPRKTVRNTGLLDSETSLERLQVKLPVAWDAGAEWHLAAGLEYLDDSYHGIKRSVMTGVLPFNGTAVSSQYGEALWYTPWGNLTASVRWDDHSHAGRLRSERLSFTRVQGAWHAKLMGSHARSAPSLEGYAAALRNRTTITPETSRNWEAELGYRASSDVQFALNLFDITTFDTLILNNAQMVRTRGMEAGFKVRKDWGHGDLSYSYYDARGTDTPNMQVMDYASGAGRLVDGSMNLAFPSHKLTASLHYGLSSGLSINPSLVYLGPRWGYVAPRVALNTGFNEGTLKRFGATPLLNVVLSWEDAGAKGLDVTLGLHNLLNEDASFIQPFNAMHAPLPGMSREILFQANYKF